jgi:hypothetical protein
MKQLSSGVMYYFLIQEKHGTSIKSSFQPSITKHKLYEFFLISDIFHFQFFPIAIHDF